MIYELRIYEALPGRLPALHARFKTHTLALFEKHGIKQVGFWTTYVGPSNNTLTYILVWESLEERQRVWDAFGTDPAWIEARTNSERDGPIVARVESMFLKPTEYSALQ